MKVTVLVAIQYFENDCYGAKFVGNIFIRNKVPAVFRISHVKS